MEIKRLICYAKAIPPLVKTGIFTPHLYEAIEEIRADIFVTDDSFRVAESYNHAVNERLIRDVTVTKAVCKFCGKELITWRYDHIPII